MRKTTIILLLIIEIFLVFIFQNLYSLFKGFEEIDFNKITEPEKMEKRFKDLKKLFSALSIVSGIMLLGTGFYLVILIRKKKHPAQYSNLPPLQDFLVELKGSENQLKNLVEQQKLDVTEKKELNKTIINHINAAVIFLNHTDRIDIFNPVATELFGQSYANAKNNKLDAILKQFPEIVAFVNHNRNGHTSSEISTPTKLFSIDIIGIENIGRLIIIKDITEERKREEIHQRSRNFSMLGEMATFLAHEVKNSLGVIYGYTRTIKTETPNRPALDIDKPTDQENDKNKIAKVNKEVQFLTGMMETFLNFSRPVKVGITREIDPTGLLQEITTEIGLPMELKITGNPNHENVITAPVVLESDATLLRSVFSNLLLNAREAGANRINVTITKNTGTDILISDNGPGIAPEIQEKIWFPFFTTKDKGTGMGLAIIRKMMSALNGEITLENSSSLGTTFKLTFFSN